jgi:hypothetical protein
MAGGPSFPRLKWLPHPFRSFIAERMGEHAARSPDYSRKTIDPYRDCPSRRSRIEPGYSGRGSFDRVV